MVRLLLTSERGKSLSEQREESREGKKRNKVCGKCHQKYYIMFLPRFKVHIVDFNTLDYYCLCFVSNIKEGRQVNIVARHSGCWS